MRSLLDSLRPQSCIFHPFKCQEAVEEELQALLLLLLLSGTRRHAPLEEHPPLVEVHDVVAAPHEAARDKALGHALARVRLRLRLKTSRRMEISS